MCPIDIVCMRISPPPSLPFIPSLYCINVWAQKHEENYQNILDCLFLLDQFPTVVNHSGITTKQKQKQNNQTHVLLPSSSLFIPPPRNSLTLHCMGWQCWVSGANSFCAEYISMDDEKHNWWKIEILCYPWCRLYRGGQVSPVKVRWLTILNHYTVKLWTKDQLGTIYTQLLCPL